MAKDVAGAEVALHDIEERYRSLEANLPVGVFRSTPEGRVISVNPAMAAMYGFASVEEMLGAPAVDFYWNPEQRRDILERLAGVGTVKDCEVEVRRRDGSTGWVSTSIQAVRDESERIVFLDGIDLDITERKMMIERLQRDEAKFRLLYEDAPLAYQSLDADGCFVDVNRAWLRTFGYSKEEVIGRWFGDFLVPDHGPLFKDKFPRFKSVGEVNGIEYEMVRKDGSHIFAAFDGRVGYTEHGNFLRTHCIMQDITERRWAEEVLRRSEEKYRILFETSPDGIAVVDLNGVVLDANRAFLDMLGYALEELRGKSYKGFTPSRWHDKEAKHMARVVSGGEIKVFEKEYIRKDGAVFPATVLAWPIKDEHGYPVKVGGFVRDVTERNKSEQELDEAHARLSAEMESTQQKNSALKEILEQIEDERKAFRQQIVANMEKVLLPTLARLGEMADAQQQELLSYLEKTLHDMTSPFAGVLSTPLSSLTPKQMEICQMIKSGLSSKEMARLLGTSVSTVHKHRERIRRTLKLQKRRVNLSAYLRKL